jgi:hypothetical protein
MGHILADICLVAIGVAIGFSFGLLFALDILSKKRKTQSSEESAARSGPVKSRRDAGSSPKPKKKPTPEEKRAAPGL